MAINLNQPQFSHSSDYSGAFLNTYLLLMPGTFYYRRVKYNFIP
jgi:hypothetical protein